ncbi:MAG: hypothetical protein J2P45_00990 [Candidatus Dormibacteraeota bacterium]|nr:hypothetical protein [Candidatus Dormibacteraeota bacterium]
MRSAGTTRSSQFTPAGAQMTDQDWSAGFAKSLAVFLNGMGIPEPGPRGERVVDDSFLLLFNAYWEQEGFNLPDVGSNGDWEVAVDTMVASGGDGPPRSFPPRASVELAARSMLVLRQLPGA